MLENLRYDIRDKLEEWGLGFSKGQVLVIAVLALIVIGGFLVLQARSRPAPVTVTSAAPKPEVTKVQRKGGQKAGSEKVVVHLTGAVAKPGVYTLARGSRVNDLIQVGGSALPTADLEAINLAAKLIDGQQIHIPKEGESARPPVGAAPTSSVGGLVNINAATVEELDKLSGVGPVLAERIVKYRSDNGGFRSVDELRQVEGIGPKKFENLKDEVVVE